MLSAALKSLYDAGASINWADYQSNFPGAHTVVDLPAYSWDLKEYWIQYVNDWTLRKGDPPLVINNVSKLESTTIHSVVEESGDSKKTHIVVEADIARKDLSPLVQGHEVDGIPLCTPSVYADIALTLGKYLLERYQPQQKDDMVVVSDMTVSKALILHGDGSRQPIQAHAEADWSSRSVSIKFMSFDVSINLSFNINAYADNLTEQGSSARALRLCSPLQGPKPSRQPPKRSPRHQAEDAESPQPNYHR
jgi:hypothetical protein